MGRFKAASVIIPLIDPLAIGRPTIYKHIASRRSCRSCGYLVNETQRLLEFAFPTETKKPRGCPVPEATSVRIGEDAKRGDGDAG